MSDFRVEVATEACPLPEVAEVLDKYIRPREEVAAIRRELQRFLESQIYEDDATLSITTLGDPNWTVTEQNPPAITGVRKAYWKALQAHGIAQAKFDSLRAELELMKRPKTERGRSGAGDESLEWNEAYTSLLRHKEKQRRLQVIDTALLDSLAAGGDLPASRLDDVVKKRLGEQPVPPSGQSSSHPSTDVSKKTLALKKAVLTMKRKVDEHKSRKVFDHPQNERHAVTADGDIAGLQNALQELTGWMEDQLTLIANADAESISSVSSPLESNGSNGAHSEPDINTHQLYDNYLHARQRLIQTVNDAAEPEVEPRIGLDSGPGAIEDLSSSTEARVKSPAETLIPFIPRLVAAKRREQSLVQQNTYIRSQISDAEAESSRLLRRLADESHLVQSGASRGNDWSAAAQNATQTTEDFVQERVRVGESSAAAARDTLRQILALKNPEGLVGGS